MFDRDRIVEATDLAGLADELLGPHRGTQRSPAWSCPSPTHAQTGRTPPLGVFRSRSGEQRWYCHGCGIGGSAVDLVMVARGVSVGAALEELAGRQGGRAEVVGERPPGGVRVRSMGAPTMAPAPGDLAGLACFVEACEARLWSAEGAAVRGWLTTERGLPEVVLAANRVGADPGGRKQARPDGMPCGGSAAVLPVVDGGGVVFAQLRPIDPWPGRPRYLNAATRLAPNPRLAMFQPPEPVGPCVVVTEGVLDALSANAAGYRAAAVLGASLAAGSPGGAPVVGDRLADLGVPLLLAFDADEAGARATVALRADLAARGARVAVVHIPAEANDLNGWMLRSRDWPCSLTGAVRTALECGSRGRRLAR